MGSVVPALSPTKINGLGNPRGTSPPVTRNTPCFPDTQSQITGPEGQGPTLTKKWVSVPGLHHSGDRGRSEWGSCPIREPRLECDATHPLQ